MAAIAATISRGILQSQGGETMGGATESGPQNRK